MARTYTKVQPKLVGSLGASENANFIKPYPEAASQTYIAGELVYLSSGKVTICGADPTIILGQAPSAATGTTDSDTQVQIITPSQVWKMNLVDGSGVALVSTQAMIGARYGLQSVSGVWCIDYSDTTKTRVTVVGFADDSAVGDTNCPVYVVFHPQFLQISGDLATS